MHSGYGGKFRFTEQLQTQCRVPEDLSPFQLPLEASAHHCSRLTAHTPTLGHTGHQTMGAIQLFHKCPSLSRIPPRITLHLVISTVSYGLRHSPNFSLFFMTFDSSEQFWSCILVECPSNWVFLVFSHDYMGYGLGKNPIEGATLVTSNWGA